MSDARKRMSEFRRLQGLNYEQMARVCKCSPGLLRIIEEDGEITHPNIASRIAAAYRLDVDGYNELVHKDHKAKELPEPKQPPVSCDELAE